MGPSAVLRGVWSLLDHRSSGSRPRYRRLPNASTYEDDDADLDDNDNGLEDGTRRRRGRIAEPFLYAEPGRRLRVTIDDDDDPVLNSVWARGNRGFLRLTLMAVSLGLLVYLGVVFSRITRTRIRDDRNAPPSCDTVAHGYQCYTKTAWNWGQYAPFFSVPAEGQDEGDDSGASSGALPPGCRYTFAQVLSRHAARDPTAGRSAAYSALMARILSSGARFVDGPDGRFAFLNDYTYRLGADELTLFGEQQMVHAGAHFYQRYQSLIQAGGHDPFVRSADQNRVVVSAINWLGGFDEARQADQADQGGTQQKDGQSGSSRRMHILLLPEEAGFNNTLSANGLCRAFSGRDGVAAQRTFAATFVPAITARLNRGLPDADLSDTDTIALMDLCPFETVADEKDDEHRPRMGGRRLSPFCQLFNEAEWRNYDYYRTLGLWYGYGGGSALGATQGVGFVNELVARLTASPVADDTSTNRTLDADPATFPLNQTVYADFSHDNDMVNIFTALGLYGNPGGDGDADGGGDSDDDDPQLLPSNTTRTEPADLRGFAGSWAVPFAARLYVEKMVCDSEGAGDDELVRILVNDRVVPLRNCGADPLGRCRLSRFVESLAFARSGGRWAECFA